MKLGSRKDNALKMRTIRLALAAEFIPVLTYLVGGDGTGNLYVDGGGPELREGSPGRNNERIQLYRYTTRPSSCFTIKIYGYSVAKLLFI